MKEKASEWVSISDLMAGVLAIVVLLLVVSVLQQMASKIAHQKIEAEQKAVIESLNAKIDQQKEQAKLVLQQIEEMFREHNLQQLLHVDLDQYKILFKEGLFSSGSACIKANVKEALYLTKTHLNGYFHTNPIGEIRIEGHTDNKPVANPPVIDFFRNCTVYDDNYTLSAARAREAMKSIWGQDPTFKHRIIVAGFGASRPLSRYEANSAIQRRVEVTFTFPSLQDLDPNSSPP